ncbi:phenylalanyl-tRNA synthetase beta chain [Aster yellows witches'-broom phytoplasma AYWB]|uniref:Phenylalanine--tRNA ligase beta subunit n=2 Tax=Aster yellows witches'-broom phytoplasma TaxID=229545 RepID=SYFB_AYWBP|nr:RecName: Full=Phenylalanine--tRNA ligase beta subunit; AltName: Full=Phenylalanyl-tRNA synthetase beta subunit; Short=PheRS [Aster yellows witches'-broom phytoplasma AYWB]ABC65251.1 phenylalanyl-tRNA synthetase beta chain [Aster yellows witches'-broom phytoplasma AYWB]
MQGTPTMKIIENILKNHLLQPLSQNIFVLTNNYITEVQKFSPLSKNTNLVVGQILNFQKIQDSQKLNLVEVNIGIKVVKIVCGASNLQNGKKVIVASEGSFLEGINSTLKNKKIYGVFSEGMLCALEELGISNKFLTPQEQEGIYLFDDPNDQIALGSNALIPLGMDGFILELGITPNRGDLLSHIGFAKDLQAVLASQNSNKKKEKKTINYKTKNSKDQTNRKTTPKLNPDFFAKLPQSPLKVQIESDSCYEYNVCILENITIKPSPLWLRNTLLQSGINPINNVVDITNLILIEYGIPLHAFDSGTIQKIKVRKAFPQETITTLNQNDFVLDENDLVITDGKKAIALAGIVGLLESSIKPTTTKIILEAAYFSPQTIAQTCQKLKNKTESSLRFERGIDQNLIPLAFQKACQLLVTLANAKITYQPTITKQKIRTNPTISLDLDFITRKIGFSLCPTQIKNWLLNLDYQIHTPKNLTLQNKNEQLNLQAPLRRYDVKIKEDVISDLTRFYGCHKLPPQTIQIPTQGKLTLKQKNIRELRKLLVNLGFYETITYSLISSEMFEAFAPQKPFIKIMNPLSQDKMILRQSLLSSLVEILSYQHKRQTFDTAFFEIGKAYFPNQEKLSLAFVLSGNFLNTLWHKQDVSSSFFVTKGILEKISSFLGITLTYQKTQKHSNFHPGMQANLLFNNQIIGVIGKTHPQLNAKHHLKESFLCELFLSDEILNTTKTLTFRPIPKFPTVIRDLSFLVDTKYSFYQIEQIIKQTTPFDLIKCELFDVYQTPTTKEKQSFALRFFFNNLDKNLEKQDVEHCMKKITYNLIKHFRIEIR